MCIVLQCVVLQCHSPGVVKVPVGEEGEGELQA